MRIARLPSCSKKIGCVRLSFPAPEAKAGVRLVPCIGIDEEYVAPARSTHVAMRSIRCPGCASRSPLREIPPGQCAIRGVEIPPSCTQCLYSLNGVFETFAQLRP